MNINLTFYSMPITPPIKPPVNSVDVDPIVDKDPIVDEESTGPIVDEE